MSIMDRLKARWNLKSGWQVLVVLIVFSCTGMSILYVKAPLFGLLGLGESEASWLGSIVGWVILLLVYQVILLIYAVIFGQFSFFWEFEKRSFGRLLRLWPK